MKIKRLCLIEKNPTILGGTCSWCKYPIDMMGKGHKEDCPYA